MAAYTNNLNIDASQVRLQVVKDAHNPMATSAKFDSVLNNIQGAANLAAPVAGAAMGAGKGSAIVGAALAGVQGSNGMGVPGYYMGSGLSSGNPGLLAKGGLNGLPMGNAPGYGTGGTTGGIGGGMAGMGDPLSDMYNNNMAMVQYQVATSQMSNQFQMLSNTIKLDSEAKANAIRNIKN